MRGYSETANNERSQELRYITEHFYELQGLRLAPIWSFMIALPLLDITHRSESVVATTLIVGTIIIALCFLWIRHWYRKRYGVVLNPSPRFKSSWQIWIFLVLFGVGLSTKILNRIDQNIEAFPVLVAVSAVLLPRCFDAAPHNGALRLRQMLYSTAALTLLLLTIWSVYHHPNRWLVFEIMTCVWLLLALLDHWTLESVLRASIPFEEVSGE